MKKIELYIKNNLQAFDEEPAEGHFDRFQQKMTERKRKTISFQRWSMAIAASLLVLLSAGALLQHLNQPAELVVVCENTDDIKQCYLSKINDAAYHIELLTKKLDIEEWEQEAVMNEVENVLYANENFDKEIPEELSDEATKSIMSDYYQRNLESLYTIAQSLEKKEK